MIFAFACVAFIVATPAAGYRKSIELLTEHGQASNRRQLFFIGDAGRQRRPLFKFSEVCPEFCVNDRVLFSGMGRWGRGHFPFPGPSL